MKNKILGLPKAAVIVIGIVITALFLVLMNLVGGVVAHLTSITDSYTLQLIAEIGVAIYAIGMLFLMGYQQSLKKTGVGFLRGFYIGGFMVGYCVYVAVAQLFLQSVSGSDGVRSAGGIMIYILTMFFGRHERGSDHAWNRVKPFCGPFFKHKTGSACSHYFIQRDLWCGTYPECTFRCAIIQRIDPGTAGNIARCAVCSNLSAQRKFMDLYHYSCTC